MTLDAFIRKLLTRFYRPILGRYLQSDRNYKHKGLKLFIPKGVFHPAFFGSSKVLIAFLEQQPLAGKTVLEIGCGSGMVALSAARQGARVSAVDISTAAVAATQNNARLNQLDLSVFSSDIFENIPIQSFDLIVCNPPYYSRRPETEAEHAWYTGEDFAFFHRFFEQVKPFSKRGAKVYLVLGASCDLVAIDAIASAWECILTPVFHQRRVFEVFTIYELKNT